MSIAATRHEPLVLRALPTANPALRALVLAGAGTALLTLSARVQVPFWPVPMTLQPLVVLLIGAFYGARLGAGTLLLYLAEGAIGMPVFAGTPERGIGLAYMAGPTGGYLLGFVAAAAVAGVAGRAHSVLRLFLGMGVACLVLYVMGAAWLATFVGFPRAITLGVVPFIFGDVLKVALAALLVYAAQRLARQDAERGPTRAAS